MQVHIDRGGQRFGPYSVEQVNSHLADGTILPSDLGWTDGMTDWVPVTQVAGVTFADATATATVPPPAAEKAIAGLPSVGAAAVQSVAKPAGNKKLMIGIGAGVGVLALAAVGYFVVYPMLTDDEGEAPADGVADNTPTPSGPGGAEGPGGPGGPGMGPPPGGGVAGGGQGGRPKGGFGGGKGGGQGGGFPGGFGGGKGGGQGGSQKGGGMNMIARFDQNKDGRLSKAEVPQQMAGLFDRMDQNKDGFVDQNEMRNMGRPKSGGQPRPPQGGGQPGGFGVKGPPKGGGQQRSPQGGPQGQPQPRNKQ